MKRLFMAAALLFCLGMSSTNIFAQFGNATVEGFVQDASGAYIPGVMVTAANTQTGVAIPVITNESGAYTIPSLLPGTYKLTAELPGFKTRVLNDLQLGANTTGRYNFTLDVGAAAETVEVTAQATALIAESSPTIGQVLTQKTVTDLPLVSTNVLNLINTMPGVQGGIYSSTATFAGIPAGESGVNTTRDGLSVQEGRYAYGVGSTTLLNPDMVGEFRVILAPVDAETGRGNGQVQISTRSGTNQFHGAGVWNLTNSALNANTWTNNKQVVRGVWTPGQPNWQNENEYTFDLGGPIKKNKTFFFFLFDQQLERDRTQMRPVVLTDCARNGIFRYWDSYQNGNINTLQSALGTANPVYGPSVDSFGAPLMPAINPNGTPYTGQLRYFSVFGPLLNTPARPDCSDAVVQPGVSWDPNRKAMDPAGFSKRYLQYMPHANVFDGGDGLNTAIYQWQYALDGTGDLNTAYGVSFVANNHQENLKLDHNFNSRNKVAINGSYQTIPNDYIPVSGPTVQWPGGYLSKTLRKPRVLTVNLTSTLSSALLNEGRFGYRANWHYVWAPWEVPDVSARQVPLSLMLNGQGGIPITYSPAGVNGLTTVSFTCSTGCAQQGNYTPLFQWADTLSWTKGKHAFKVGVDLRYTYTYGYETPAAPIPKALGGAGNNPNTKFTANAAIPNFAANNATNANSLLYFLSGSLNSAQMYYYVSSPTNPQWQDFSVHARKLSYVNQNDWATFVKDDWKVRPDFTLNIGLRYEHYGTPYSHNGLTPQPVGGGLALLGVTGRSFSDWLKPGVGPVNLANQTQIELVGPNSANPSRGLYKNDWKTLGPAVGFSWQPPWEGKGKTNIRGGYQISYVKPGNLGNLVNDNLLNPGFSTLAMTSGPLDGSYFDLTNLPSMVPIAPTVQPLAPFPITKPTQNLYAFQTNTPNPYIQNLTLSVTREITRKLSLDVRYIGTRGLKLDGIWDLNIPNVFYNAPLFNAFETVRKGGNDPLFDQIFMGLNLNPGVAGCDPSNPAALCGAVNGTTQTGSQALRLSSTFRTALANGDYNSLASALNVFNGTGTGASGTVNFGTSGERGTVLKRANLGFNVAGGNSGSTIPSNYVAPAGLFPANWINANPQVNSAFYETNTGKSNYNSLQVQTNIRAAQGLTFQGTYIWSRSLALSPSSYTNPANRDPDYNLAPTHVTQDLRANYTYALPIGTGRTLLGNTGKWIDRVVGGWQTSGLIQASSGNPVSITASNTLYGNGVPDVVGPFSAKPFGHVQWSGNAGNVFGGRYTANTADPQCAQIAAVLQPYCTLLAVTDSTTGHIVLQQPQPGHRGTLGQKTLELPGTWDFDAALTKVIRLSESKSFQIRMDSTDVFNHPLMGAPNLSTNTSTSPFGSIQTKNNSHRMFKAQLRLNF
ncbi:MAG TPA: carboxypeptidase regulatory-like domain-containing protein [Terriglobia bacterium]|jgi:hypothetical protein